MHKTLIALAFGLLSSTAMAAQMYRWVDAQGVTQFGQQPPEGRAYERVDIRSAPPPGGTLRAPAAQPEAEPENQMQSPEQTADGKAFEARRLEQCGQLQANLRTMESNPRLSRTNEAGEVERIGEEERQALMAQTRADLEAYCKK